MTTLPLRYFVVDASTDRPFAGNPAAVVPLPDWRDKAWLQSVAMEMNLWETAFLVPNAQGFDLRWFTPKVEVQQERVLLGGQAVIVAPGRNSGVVAGLFKLSSQAQAGPY